MSILTNIQYPLLSLVGLLPLLKNYKDKKSWIHIINMITISITIFFLSNIIFAEKTTIPLSFILSILITTIFITSQLLRVQKQLSIINIFNIGIYISALILITNTDLSTTLTTGIYTFSSLNFKLFITLALLQSFMIPLHQQLKKRTKNNAMNSLYNTLSIHFSCLFSCILLSYLILPTILNKSLAVTIATISITICAIIMLHTILRKKLYDNQLPINHILNHIITCSCLLVLYGLLQNLLKSVPTIQQNIQYISIIYWIFCCISYEFLRINIQATTDKLFIKYSYNYQSALLFLSNMELFDFSIKELNKKIETLFNLHLDIPTIYFLFPQHIQNHYSTSTNLISLQHIQHELPDSCIEAINKSSHLIIKTKTIPNLPASYKSFVYVIKVNSTNNHFALIFISEKNSLRPYNHEDFQLFSNISNQLALYLKLIKQARLSSQINLAKTIQNEIIPKQLSLPNCDTSTFFESAEEVGGDYYDIFKKENHSWILFGDVSGHGIGSGIVMFMVQSIFTTLIHSTETIHPAELNLHANKMLCNVFERLSEQRPMTIATLYTNNGKNFLIHGSHENIYLFKSCSKDIVPITLSQIPIGIGLTRQLDNSLFKNKSIDLLTNDILILCTDGILECTNTTNEEYGEKRLLSIIKNNHTQTTKQIKQKLIQDVKEFTNKTLTDDASLILIKSSI